MLPTDAAALEPHNLTEKEALSSITPIALGTGNDAASIHTVPLSSRTIATRSKRFLRRRQHLADGFSF